MQTELADAIAELEDEIKAELTARDADTMTAGPHTIRWTTYSTARLDAKALQAELPEIAVRYMKVNTARRFLIA